MSQVGCGEKEEKIETEELSDGAKETLTWLRKYVQETPLEALPYAFSAYTRFGVLFWGILFTILIVITIIQCSVLVAQYLSIPTQTTVETVGFAAVAFPNTTLCVPLYPKYMLTNTSWIEAEETLENYTNEKSLLDIMERSWIPEISDCINYEQQCTYGNCLMTNDYIGTRNTTVDGTPCHNWSKKISNMNPVYLQPEVQEAYHLGDHNYCRLCGSEKPWCYTPSGPYTWDWCFKPCSSTTSHGGRVLLATAGAFFYHMLTWRNNQNSPQRSKYVSKGYLEIEKNDPEQAAMYRMIASLEQRIIRKVGLKVFFEKFEHELCKAFHLQVERIILGSDSISGVNSYQYDYPCQNWRREGLMLTKLTEYWSCFLFPFESAIEPTTSSNDEVIIEFGLRPLLHFNWTEFLKEYDCASCHTPIRVEAKSEADGWISESGFRMDVNHRQNVLMELGEVMEMLPEKQNCEANVMGQTWRAKEVCLEQCLMDNFMHQCRLQCHPFSVYLSSYDETIPYCDWKDLDTCQDDDAVMERRVKDCKSKCPFPCTRLRYTTHLKEQYLYDNKDTGKSLISIWFQTFSYLQITEEKSMTLAELFSEIGGALGLWIGGSIVALVHFIYFCIANCYTTYISPPDGSKTRAKSSLEMMQNRVADSIKSPKRNEIQTKL